MWQTWRQVLIISLLGLLVGISPVGAQSDQQLAKCSAVEDSIRRLACFDDLAAERDVAKPKTVAETSGKWQVVTETSKIDDSKNVSLLLEANNQIAARFGSTGTPQMYIVCRENQTHVFWTFAGQFMADNGSFGDITVRVDKQKARSISTNESTDHGALGLWRGAGVPFLKQLIGGRTLFMRATPFNESPVDVEFPIEGLAEALKPLRAACGW